MPKCGCSDQACGCVIVAGAGAKVEGSGQARNPYRVSLDTGGSAGGGGGFDAGDLKHTSRVDTPPGWLECNGQTVSRTTYADLYAAIGTRWGAGDGQTTFNVPDLTGRALVGAGSGFNLAASGGAAETVLSVGNLPAHRHAVGNHQHDMSHNHDMSHGHGNTGTASANHQHDAGKVKFATQDNTKTDGNGKRVTNIGSGDQDFNVGATSAAGADHVHGTAPFNGGTGGDSRGGATGLAGAQDTTDTGSGQGFTNYPPYRAVRVLIRT